MLKIQIPPQILEQLRRALIENGNLECGGIMMGEHISENNFRILEITVQNTTGSFSSFLRKVADILAPLQRFFERTNNHYRKFNYIGEWHSHPSFSLYPSTVDFKTMLNLVEDPDVGANFVLLLLVKLTNGIVKCKAWSLLAGEEFIEAKVVLLETTND